jgi:hypothetical protein
VAGCPFYGFRWPERSATLERVGGNECGLDYERNSACTMELESKEVDYFGCPRVRRHLTLLGTARHLIRIASESGVETLDEWERRPKLRTRSFRSRDNPSSRP